ncbi:ABC transporter permease [Alicyclobacillus fastidiosus]|uniref:ABC transporter permease n=1 Tax=Alicyclobacillus fastidiosus TaxID=392011 RepID=A0ABV5AEN4_9BACL|nr:ABC transporter permease [Alicyclobacillus fastidiosus]WEH09540.1 ABC transporter permease [Alicyclobacillus fastidiosus]
MRAKRLVKTAFTSLWHKPLRTMLTMLGIIIGVAAVVALMSYGSATTGSVTSQIQGLGTNLLVITPGQTTQNGVSQGLGSAQTLTQSDVTALQKDSLLSAVAPDATSRGQVEYQSTNYQTRLEGSTADLLTVRNLKLSGGRMFNLVDEQQALPVAVIGPTTAENVFGNANPVGKTIWINGLTFQVIGELASQGSSGATNNDDEILMPLSTLQQDFTGTTYLDTIYASAIDAQHMQQAQQQVENTLRQSHGLSWSAADDFTITNQSTLLGTLSSVSKSLQMFLGGIAGISLLVGGIGIMNIMLVSVTERTREIGLRKALGATRSDILNQFLAESGMVGILGGLIGVGLGMVSSLALGRIASETIHVDWSAVWISFVVAFVVGLVFGVYPAFRAARLSPMNALRYE